ncbi:MAG: hypothetical protein KatS3mg021_0853 [Fimbriimonadales bacterium]|nr:MAG: hypothetical protein KatS3mg021_0853 [Fimbriimonadales bacterium]
MFRLIRTDMLGNPAIFTLGDSRATDVVQQRGLAVVYMSHDGHNRRARLGSCNGLGNRNGLRLGFRLLPLEAPAEVACQLLHQFRFQLLRGSNQLLVSGHDVLLQFGGGNPHRLR